MQRFFSTMKEWTGLVIHKGSKETDLTCNRIVGVADVVETMTYHRPYRDALGLDAALEEIKKNKGILYDPEVVDACIMIFLEKRFKLTGFPFGTIM